jgi:hypothetical protein
VSIRARTCWAFDHVAFVNEQLGDAPGVFGVDVNLVGFGPTVSRA